MFYPLGLACPSKRVLLFMLLLRAQLVNCAILLLSARNDNCSTNPASEVPCPSDNLKHKANSLTLLLAIGIPVLVVVIAIGAYLFHVFCRSPSRVNRSRSKIYKTIPPSSTALLNATGSVTSSRGGALTDSKETDPALQSPAVDHEDHDSLLQPPLTRYSDSTTGITMMPLSSTDTRTTGTVMTSPTPSVVTGTSAEHHGKEDQSRHPSLPSLASSKGSLSQSPAGAGLSSEETAQTMYGYGVGVI